MMLGRYFEPNTAGAFPCFLPRRSLRILFVSGGGVEEIDVYPFLCKAQRIALNFSWKGLFS